MAPGMRPAAQRGFTLIEIMVVVLIIAILVGAAVLSMGTLGSDRELQREAQRLQALLQLMQEEALMQGRDYGVEIRADGYGFLVFDHEQFAWAYPAAEDLLIEHALPGELTMELFLDGREIVLEETQDEDELETPEPHIMVLSSGEMTPFELGFYRDLLGGRFVITGELTGSLELERRGFDQP